MTELPQKTEAEPSEVRLIYESRHLNPFEQTWANECNKNENGHFVMGGWTEATLMKKFQQIGGSVQILR